MTTPYAPNVSGQAGDSEDRGTAQEQPAEPGAAATPPGYPDEVDPEQGPADVAHGEPGDLRAPGAD